MSEQANKELAAGQAPVAESEPSVEPLPEPVATVEAGAPTMPTTMPVAPAPAPAPAPSPFVTAPARTVGTPRPLLGPALRVYGALLWSYVVFGQFTTSWIDDRPLGEGWALLGVFATTATVAVLAVRRSVKVAPTGAVGLVRRTAAAVAIALLAWFTTVAGVTLSRAFNGDTKNAMALVAMALTASIVGLRMNRAPEGTERMHGRRVLQVMIWITLAVVTLVAGAELVAVG
jgi:hypothetical protein